MESKSVHETYFDTANTNWRDVVCACWQRYSKEMKRGEDRRSENPERRRYCYWWFYEFRAAWWVWIDGAIAEDDEGEDEEDESRQLIVCKF